MSGMNCLVGSPMDNSIESKWTNFEYWYAVEASSDDAETFRYDLESAIYQAATTNMVWCSQGGVRRVQEAGETYYLDDQGRRLGIMALTSAPMDILQPSCKYYQSTVHTLFAGNKLLLASSLAHILSSDLPAGKVERQRQLLLDSRNHDIHVSCFR